MSKYEKGDKIVIEIAEVIGDDEYRISEFIESEPLSTYTEPLERRNENKQKRIEKLVDRLHNQAAEITRLLEENKKLKAENTEQARAEGQKEAWELARKIVNMPLRAKRDIWGGETCLPTSDEIFTDTYPEAAAKVSQWEKAKEEIKVGDIIKVDVNGLYAIVTHESDEFANVVHADGNVYLGRKDGMTKTGRHIDIDGFLKQIGGEE